MRGRTAQQNRGERAIPSIPTYIPTFSSLSHPTPPPPPLRCQALFKPTMEGHGDGWHRVPIEAAAYSLNLLLGMDYVPPAVFRSSCDVDWQVGGPKREESDGC